jgi:hypothetical protein
MLTLNDIDIIESDEASAEEYYAALQRAINSGMAWKMQGSYGRTAMNAISAGLCLLGREACADYWGNVIPGRDDVKPGSKGSALFVIKKSGQEWAAMMEGV